jgi:hypothetical protein
MTYSLVLLLLVLSHAHIDCVTAVNQNIGNDASLTNTSASISSDATLLIDRQHARSLLRLVQQVPVPARLQEQTPVLFGTTKPRLVIHIGPSKTGTTSLETDLMNFKNSVPTTLFH